MSRIFNIPLSPPWPFTDIVLPLSNASMKSIHKTTLVIHNEFIHPWSTIFEHWGLCSEKNKAPSGATGTGLLASHDFLDFPATCYELT